jgi:hypothetical protein
MTSVLRPFNCEKQGNSTLHKARVLTNDQVSRSLMKNKVWKQCNWKEERSIIVRLGCMSIHLLQRERWHLSLTKNWISNLIVVKLLINLQFALEMAHGTTNIMTTWEWEILVN